MYFYCDKYCGSQPMTSCGMCPHPYKKRVRYEESTESANGKDKLQLDTVIAYSHQQCFTQQ